MTAHGGIADHQQDADEEGGNAESPKLHLIAQAKAESWNGRPLEAQIVLYRRSRRFFGLV
jgi:hypothetical protein